MCCLLHPLPQGYRKRHMNVLGPAMSPTVANGIVTQVRAVPNQPALSGSATAAVSRLCIDWQGG